MLPLIAAAMTAGAVRGIVGGLQAKHASNVNKNLIGEAYRNAAQQLQVRQRNTREGAGESLVQRGMMQGGQATNTVGGQAQEDLSQQFGFESRDLDFQRRSALAENKASLVNGYMGAATGAVQTAANVYSTGQMMKGAYGLHPLTAEPTTPIDTSGMPGPGDVSNIGAGQPNYAFQVGGS